jgi:hypothetical protein
VNTLWAAEMRVSSSEAEFGNVTEMKKTASIAISMDASHVVKYLMVFSGKFWVARACWQQRARRTHWVDEQFVQSREEWRRTPWTKLNGMASD